MTSTLTTPRSPFKSDPVRLAPNLVWPSPWPSSSSPMYRNGGGVIPLHDSKASPVDDEPDSVPANKRRRIERDAGAVIDRPLWAQVQFQECLKKQVFPHVERALAELPEHRCNTQKIGTLAVAGLTGAQFTEEYKRGHGNLSAAFEIELAARARSEIMRLASLPEHQIQSILPVPKLPATIDLLKKSETPIPIPSVPPPKALPIAQSAAPQQPRAAQASTSAVPLPKTFSDAERGKQQAQARPLTNAAPQPHAAATANNADNPIFTTHRTFPYHGSAGVERAESKSHSDWTAETRRDTAASGNRRSPGNREKASEDESKSSWKKPPRPSSAPANPPQSNGRAPRAHAGPVYNLKQLTYGSRDPQASSSPAPRLTSQHETKLKTPTKHVPTTPQNFRTRFHAMALRRAGAASQPGEDSAGGNQSLWFSASRQPYMSLASRKAVLNSNARFTRLGNESDLQKPWVFHVDFTEDELEYLRRLACRILALPDATTLKLLRKGENRAQLMRELPAAVQREGKLPNRSVRDIGRFITDIDKRKAIPTTPRVLALVKDESDSYGARLRSGRVHSLLFARELFGNGRWSSTRTGVSFQNELRKCREDDMELRSEWTNCAGDIATVAWVSNDGFICGTTEHSDAHNQQYNKPGNLVLGSCSLDSLRAYPDHRVVRPLVEKGENSTEAMRESQDPWLYCSVVSSDYDAAHDRAYTSGFDRAVKIWKVQHSGASMTLLGEWPHGGNVNFVAASKHSSGMVATATDVSTGAVRVYHVSRDDITNSRFHTFSCSRITDLEGNVVLTDKWAYFPATLQWGLSPEVQTLLLVGYSPRSLTSDDNDIPEDRRDSGELCLWDGITGEKWKVTSVNRQNIFEVAWHPSQPCFVAATSPSGLDISEGTRTQIRVFRLSENIFVDGEDWGRGFSAMATLDCSAVDINELTIMPNCADYCYVTAGCTDGNVYVWDTARSDQLLHLLRHGKPVEELHGEREREDTGVKFTAWGSTPNRFYTGSSDGVVKVWDVGTLGKPLVRDMLEVPAPVSFGMFSPDKSKLVIGDASGRVFLLGVDEPEKSPAAFVTLPTLGAIRRPKPVIPHPEPDPPEFDALDRRIEAASGPARGHAYLERGELRLVSNPTIGAVQGPHYAALGLYDRRAHMDGDPSKPLFAYEEAKQQASWKMFRQSSLAGSTRALGASTNVPAQHLHNTKRDLDLESLSEQLRAELLLDGADLQLNDEYDLEFEEMPSGDEF